MTHTNGATAPHGARPAPGRIAMLSMHTSPLAPPGGRETGGMNVYVRAVSGALARAGLRVDVFTRRDDPAAPELGALPDGARLVRVPAGPPRPAAAEEQAAWTGEFASGVRAFAAREGGGYGLVHSHYWLSAAAGRELARAWDAPHVAMFHTLAEVKLRAGASDGEPPERIEAERALAPGVDRVVVATEHERLLLGEIYGVPPERTAVIPPGVDRERFRPRDRAAARAALGVEAGARVLLAAGRLEPPKGLDLLIGALGEMTRREGLLLIVVGGDGRAEPERARLRALAAARGVASLVRFEGAAPHERIGTYYNAADVVVAPSAYESFGLVAAEAMASGVPVVASRVGGLASTVADGRTGCLVARRCPRAFAEKLDLLLADEPLRLRLGAAAAESMRAYDWRAVASRLRGLYAALAARAPAAAGA